MIRPGSYWAARGRTTPRRPWRWNVRLAESDAALALRPPTALQGAPDPTVTLMGAPGPFSGDRDFYGSSGSGHLGMLNMIRPVAQYDQTRIILGSTGSNDTSAAVEVECETRGKRRSARAATSHGPPRCTRPHRDPHVSARAMFLYDHIATADNALKFVYDRTARI
jgi:hypothetical protein